MGNGGYRALQSDVFLAAMGTNLYKVMDIPEVNSGIKSHLVYRPLADTLTFGLYSYLTGSDAAQSSSSSTATVAPNT